MGSSLPSISPASPAFLAAFRARAGAAGALSFAEFMELALYDPHVGYYRRDHPRVGFGPGTDFYTASTSAPMFGELVAAACVDLLGASAAAVHTFVEIGAESGAGILQGVAAPFAAARTIRAGDDITLTGRCIVFSNELFDAQPFRRMIWRSAQWREIGVQIAGDQLGEIELGPVNEPILPATAAEGYVIDLPSAAATLARRIAAQSWTGLFIACDYGKSWPELTQHVPAGTARAYFRHTQSNELLARPGEQDLTCHICWDWLVEALAEHGFRRPTVESQEAFFLRHAGPRIAATVEADAARFSSRKMSLLQLLHPSNLGQKFQVLHAVRP
jgi:SAM-dependent MidA family methyltransferase